MPLSDIYGLRVGHKGMKGDAILPLLPGTPLMLTKNIDIPLGKCPIFITSNSVLGLVNGAVVEFYGFADTHLDVQLAGSESNITGPPTYMLVKLLHEVDVNISIPGLPPSVVAIEPAEFRHNAREGKYVKLVQFPFTLAYAITDYKCQGLTFEWVIVDLKKPTTGFSTVSSPYVQLSRAKALNQLSIMWPFDAEELRTPLSTALQEELQWQEDMDATTRNRYR